MDINFFTPKFYSFLSTNLAQFILRVSFTCEHFFGLSKTQLLLKNPFLGVIRTFSCFLRREFNLKIRRSEAATTVLAPSQDKTGRARTRNRETYAR